MEQYDIAVIGAGPAGLFCAIHSIGPGIRVLLLEKNLQPGMKLRISGTGQCNITHDGDIRMFFPRYGAHGQFLRPALMSYTNQMLIRFFEERNLPMEITEGGKVFPVSHKAGDVCEVLIRECQHPGVDLRCGEPVHRVENTPLGFVLYTAGDTFSAKNLVIATGGASYPKTGSTGDGYRLAASLGHTITGIGPALTPLLIRNFPFADLAGMSFAGLPFSVWRENRKIFDGQGDILFTHTGLSGPGILDRSRDIRAGDEIRLSFAGPVQCDTFEREFQNIISRAPTRSIKTIIAGLGIPERLARQLPDLAGIPADSTGAHMTAAGRTILIGLLTACPLVVSSLGDLSVAMVTRGGVALGEVHAKTMESKQVPGLFFAGEVLDIDGDTGGFNLQAAFSTGFLAALGIRKRVGKRT
ncbi:NAD(P)/FAD-dependent oxidoreductase [Methanoregula sp.]|uniref:NAD(P)/FAD-dependent oxidoreductase n=1 Tax=Methanoregula sp. TaxID=2052170 RepID=UPI0025DB3EA6|nr:NAD(P)/FAD-dependent oxidoreductase [Methanoregula sp.]